MSNYSTLKADIINDIKQNGSNAITGQLLQDNLIAMVNSLGAGYQYMGVADLNTPSSSPDYKCFYVVSEAGTYTNFVDSNNDPLVVNDGEVAIFKWDSAWSKEVTGAAKSVDVATLQEETAGITTISSISPSVDYSDYYINANGNLASLAGYSVTENINVSAGDILYITCIARGACVVAEHIGSTNHIPLVLNDANAIKTYFFQSDRDRSVRFCYETNHGLVIKKVENKVFLNQYKIARAQDAARINGKNYLITRFSPGLGISGKYVDANGDAQTATNFSITEAFAVRKGDIVNFRSVSQNTITALAKVNAAGSAHAYTEILTGASQSNTPYTFNDYTYTATEDAELVVSYFGTSSVEVALYTCVDNAESAFADVFGLKKEESFAVVTAYADQYIDTNGAYRASAGYIVSGVIHLNKGDKISSTFKTNQAAICEVLYPQNAYRVLAVGSSYSVAALFEYTATESIDIVLSCYIGSGTNPTATIVRGFVKDYIDGRFDNIDLKIYDTNICRIPQSVICIGDSVTEGITKDYAMTPPLINNTDRSYPAYLQKINNPQVVTNAGVGGYDAKEWWHNSINNYDFTQYEVAIIEFGYNDGLNSAGSGTFAADVEPYSDYNDFADTRVGCYGKIIGKIQEVNPRCLVILNVSPLLDRYYPGSSDAVYNLAQKFGIPCNNLADDSFIDLNDPAYHGLPSAGATTKDDVHLTPAGYAAKALLVNKFLAKNLIEYTDLFDNMLYFGV